MGVTLNQYMGWFGPLTHRQHLLNVMLTEEEFNRPSRTDYYIMSLTATVQRLLAKNPQSITLDQQQITFTKKTKESEEEERKRQIEFSKAIWIGAAGGMRSLTIKDQNGNIIKHPEVPARARRQQQSRIAPIPQGSQAKGNTNPIANSLKIPKKRR